MAVRAELRTSGARPAARGRLIAFEGGEAAGKSTQVAALAEWLTAAGRTVRVTREPGATELGRRIRELLLHTDSAIAPRAEALLFAADRAEHVASVIEPALLAGEVVLTDRYVDSSLAYQGGGRELTIEDVRGLSDWATSGLVPDLTVLLDLPAREGLARAGRRGATDRLEAESIEFHDRVRAAFLSLAAAAPSRYLVLDATAPADMLGVQIRDAVEALLATDQAAGGDPSAGADLPAGADTPAGSA
jgi:dTMP kinase